MAVSLSPRNRLWLPRNYRKPVNPVLDKTHHLSRGLIGYWPMGDANGGAMDICGGNYATASSPLPYAAALNGGQSLTFNGTANYMAPPDVYYLENWSVSAWVKTTSTSGLKVFFAQADATAQNYQFWVGTTGLGYTESGSNFKNLTTTAITANAWHHIVGVLSLYGGGDSGTTSAYGWYYDNGTLTGNNVTSINHTITSGKGTVAIGRLGGFSGLYWPGQIENLRLYNRALNAAEVRQLYAEPFAGVYDLNANLVGSGAVDASVNLSGISATASAGSLAPSFTGNAALSGIESTAAVGTFGINISHSLTLSGISATAAAGTFALVVDSTFGLTGAEAVAAVGDARPTQVLVTVPMITIMNDNPIPDEGDMVDDDIPMEGDMPSQLAFEGVINTNPIPMSGTLSAVPVPGEGSVP